MSDRDDASLRDGVAVRRASADDHLDVLRVVDGANLELAAETVERRIDAGTVVVATEDDRVVGALVAVPPEHASDADVPPEKASEAGPSVENGAHVEAVAVRRRRRAQGIGSALVTHAVDEWTPLTATFGPGVKPFYESLGFDCERRGDRYRGVLGSEDA